MPEVALNGQPSPVVMEIRLALPRFSRGKVRDIYDLGDELLIVIETNPPMYSV